MFKGCNNLNMEEIEKLNIKPEKEKENKLED